MCELEGGTVGMRSAWRLAEMVLSEQHRAASRLVRLFSHPSRLKDYMHL